MFYDFRFAKKIGVNIKELTQAHFPELVDRNISSIDIASVSKELKTDISTLDLIINAFKQKTNEDHIITFCKPVYSMAVQATDQIIEGLNLTGNIVANILCHTRSSVQTFN